MHFHMIITKSREVWCIIRDPLMPHQGFAIATQVPLCKNEWLELEKMENKPHNTHYLMSMIWFKREFVKRIESGERC